MFALSLLILGYSYCASGLYIHSCSNVLFSHTTAFQLRSDIGNIIIVVHET